MPLRDFLSTHTITSLSRARPLVTVSNLTQQRHSNNRYL